MLSDNRKGNNYDGRKSTQNHCGGTGYADQAGTGTTAKGWLTGTTA
jgi:hypothetical protein